MISEEEEPQEMKKPEEPQVPEVCATCKFWQPFMIRPQDHQGIGPCINQKNLSAPFGAVMAGFGSCECWEKDDRQKQKIIQAPAALNKNLQSRIIRN